MCRTTSSLDKNSPSDGKKQDARPSYLSSWSVFYDTWRNHFLNSGLYASVMAYGWHRATGIAVVAFSGGKNHGNSSTSVGTWSSMVLHCLVGGIAALSLKAELSFMWQRRRLPPGDSGYPVFGHLPRMMKDMEAFLTSRLRRYGSISTYNLLMHPVFLVSDEQDVRWAMTLERKGQVVGLVLPHFANLLGNDAIMVQSGDAHRRLRKAFEPAFTPVAIRDYAATIDVETQKSLAAWSQSGEYQSSTEWASLAMRIFFVCAFGEADEGLMKKLAYLFRKWVEGFTAPIPLRIPGTKLAKAHHYKEQLGSVLMEMVQKFREQNPPNSKAGQTSVMGRMCYSKDEDGNLPTDKVLIDNLRFFLFAGYDSTKATFSALSHFLKHNPEVEELLAAEAQTFQGDTLDVDQLRNEAPILNAVMAETWRLTAPLALHSTVAAQDLHYKGYFIPKGTFVAIDIQGHAVLNDDLYPNASQFAWERWLPKGHPMYDPKTANAEEIDYNIMNSKFRTFNFGPHMCLGAHFAKLEVRIVLTRLFQKYRVEIRNERVMQFPVRQHANDFKLSLR